MQITSAANRVALNLEKLGKVIDTTRDLPGYTEQVIRDVEDDLPLASTPDPNDAAHLRRAIESLSRTLGARENSPGVQQSKLREELTSRFDAFLTHLGGVFELLPRLEKLDREAVVTQTIGFKDALAEPKIDPRIPTAQEIKEEENAVVNYNASKKGLSRLFHKDSTTLFQKASYHWANLFMRRVEIERIEKQKKIAAVKFFNGLKPEELKACKKRLVYLAAAALDHAIEDYYIARFVSNSSDPSMDIEDRTMFSVSENIKKEHNKRFIHKKPAYRVYGQDGEEITEINFASAMQRECLSSLQKAIKKFYLCKELLKKLELPIDFSVIQKRKTEISRGIPNITAFSGLEQQRTANLVHLREYLKLQEIFDEYHDPTKA